MSVFYPGVSVLVMKSALNLALVSTRHAPRFVDHNHMHFETDPKHSADQQ